MRRRRGTRASLLVAMVAVVAGVALVQGCNAVDRRPDPTSPPPGHGPYTGTVADWPLWFPRHYFGTDCFSVRACRIDYGGLPHLYETRQPTFESLGRPVEKVLRASTGPIRNFPPPAEVTWTTLDGVELSAIVDIAEIFADRLVRHPVPRDDIMRNAHIPFPGIILVVDGRTIHVYMSTWIPLKESRKPGNPVGDLHTGLVHVHSRTY
ncbi:hypothetical protein H9645_08015 [Luteimonas sp. Sa2BVA3]|uniref:GerMN domain-containing protein n=1 Tax=Luteimonas colneyensis TaxID=2762230 RepID=A0ABR8UJJ7_9GAMM|nr:hypothetical protein [Luteimonas colneyensis]MBD7987973.1 hypothetical protein [Luteimonas colneyensis]